MRYLLLLAALLPACVDGELMTYAYCSDVEHVIGCNAEGCDVIVRVGKTKVFVYGEEPPEIGDTIHIYSTDTASIGVVDSDCRHGQ